MKANRLIAVVAAAVVSWAGAVWGQGVTNNFSFTVNQGVPDGDWNGLALSSDLEGMGGVIGNVTVTLDLAGGYNGDLYAYLVHGDGYAVLLNRVGLSTSNSVGYADAGMTVTFSDTAAGDIHFYGGNGGLALTGVYQPDGRVVTPVVTPAGSYDGAARSAMLSSFQGLSADGTWTLYVADLSGGGQSTLESWDLQIVEVPEPGTWALVLLLGTVLGVGRARWWRQR